MNPMYLVPLKNLRYQMNLKFRWCLMNLMCLKYPKYQYLKYRMNLKCRLFLMYLKYHSHLKFLMSLKYHRSS
jgi:hypothetical protein